VNIKSASAHFDSEYIFLEQESEIEPEAKSTVTVLPKQDDEREAWINLSSKRLEDAYDSDEIGVSKLSESC
jgi:hypothetical protein